MGAAMPMPAPDRGRAAGYHGPVNAFPGRAWQHSMWRLAAWLGACLLLGLLLGHTAWALCAGLAAALGWHYWQLGRLLRRLAQRRAGGRDS